MRSQGLPLLIDTGLYRRKGGAKLVDLPAHEYLQSLDLEITSAGAWKGSVVLVDAKQRLMQDVFLDAGGIGEVVLSMRWAYGERGGLPSATPLFSAAVLSAVPEFSADGDRITLDVCANQVAVAAFTRRDRDALVGMRASDAVRQIATENQWQVLVEETDYTVPYLTRDAGTTDLSFLRWICDLVPGERRTSPRRQFIFYWDTTGTLHFHSREYQARRLKRYTYIRGADSEVLSFAPETENIANALRGGGPTTYVGTDSLNGKKLEVQTSVTGEPTSPGLVTLIGNDSYTQLVGDGPLTRIMVASSGREEFEQELVGHNLRLRDTMVTANMEVVGTHDLTVADEVELAYRSFRDARDHPLSGRYWIKSVKHSIGDGWKTAYELQRAGYSHTMGATRQGGAGKASPPGIEMREGDPPAAPSYPKGVRL